MIQKTPIFLILFLIFSSPQIRAQIATYKTIDSLKTALKVAKDDTQKTDLLTKLSSYPDYIGPDNAIRYGNLALYFAGKTKNEKQIGETHGNLGIAYEIKSDYAHALKNIYKALEVTEKTNDIESLINLYNNIGLIYIDLLNFKKGLEFYNKALALSYQSKNEKSISLLLNNIGDVYLQKEEYKKALNYFYRALIINKKNSYNDETGINLTNIGICYIDLKNYEKGIEILNKSMAVYEDQTNLYNTYNHYELGRAYYLMSQDERYTTDKRLFIDNAIVFLNNSLLVFKKYNTLKDIKDTYLYISKANKAIGNYAIALDCFENYSNIKDSIFSKESARKMANLEFQREIDLKDKQIEIQTLKINSETRKVYFLITVAAAVAALLGLFLFLYFSKRKNHHILKEKNLLISNINSQKDKFYSIIAHDLRGPFNGFLGLTELMAEDIEVLTTEEIKFAAINMRSSAKNLFALLENLLEWSRMEQNLIPFDPQTHSLHPLITESIVTLNDNADKKEITITTTIPDTIEVYADKNMFQAIIRNIVLNAIKFTPKNGSITIEAKEDEQNTTLIVSDNGVGMSPKIIENLFRLDVKNNRIGTDDEPSTGLGLILCKEFIEKHKGKIRVESEVAKGSTFYIIFPKTN